MLPVSPVVKIIAMPDEQPIHSDDPEAMPYMQQVARPKISGLATACLVFGIIGNSWLLFTGAMAYIQWHTGDFVTFALGLWFLMLGFIVVPAMGIFAILTGIIVLATHKRFLPRSKRRAITGIILGVICLAACFTILGAENLFSLL